MATKTMGVVDVAPDSFVGEIRTPEVDQALRRYKRKFQRTQIIKELRRRKEFTKPSVERRNQLLKAIYKQRKQRQEEL